MKWTAGRIGVPLLLKSLAWFECQVVGERPAGDHVLVLGKVIDGKLLNPKPRPWPIAKLAAWTAPLRCFPTFSAIKWRYCPAIFYVGLNGGRACERRRREQISFQTQS